MQRKVSEVIVLSLFLLSAIFGIVPVSAPNPTIKVGVIGPQGLPFWSPAGMKEGAELAVSEINAAGGINVGGTMYDFELLYGNEYAVPTPDPAAAQLEVTNLVAAGAKFLIGGFRTEVTGPMIETAMDLHTPFFIDGASTNELIRDLSKPANYTRYKYLFRVMPTNSTSNLRTLCAFYQYILQQVLLPKYGEYLWPGAPHPQVRVAVLAEDLQWTLSTYYPLTNPSIYPALLGPYANVTYAARVPPTTPDFTSYLTAVKDSQARLLIHMFSGPSGYPLTMQMRAMGVETLPVGINAWAQFETYWSVTSGSCEYETILSTAGTETPIVPGVTDKFWRDFVGNFSQWPLYTAFGAYDCIYMLAQALEAAGSTDVDSLIAYLEDPSFERMGLLGNFKFDSFHDVYSDEYGPYWTQGHVRPLIVQWQGGKLEVVWPIDQPYSKNFLPLMPSIISINDVKPSKRIVFQGFSVSVNVTVENQGQFPARFGVAAPYWEDAIIPANPQWENFWKLGDVNTDGYIDDEDLRLINETWGSQPGDPDWNPDCDLNQDLRINFEDVKIFAPNYGKDIWSYSGLPSNDGTQTGVKLVPGGQTTVTLWWNTTGVTKGNYTLTAAASYRFYTDGWVIVAMVGDLTGPSGWPDGKVDIRDLAAVAMYYGQTSPPAPVNYDVTGPVMGVPDGRIDIRDLALIAMHYGEIDP